MAWICPYCEQKTVRIRTSRQEHILLRRMWVQCDNLNCGWTGTCNCEYDGTLSPSAIDKPQIRLPLAKRAPNLEQPNTPDLFDDE